MNSDRSIKLLIFTLAVALLPQLLWLSPWLSLIVILPLLWRLLAIKRRWRPPSALLRSVIALLGLGAVVLEFNVIWGRRAGTAMLALMMAFKLLECYRTRDSRILCSLCFFLAAAQFLFLQTMPMLVYGFLVVSGGLLTLMSIQRDEAYDRSQPENRHFARRMPKLMEAGTLRIIALSMPLALVLFFLFPRLGSPIWGMPEFALDGKTGLSDSMSPGDFRSLFIDDSPAFRVTFEGQLPPPHLRYWRGPAFWNFDGRTWGPMRRSFRSSDPRAFPRQTPSSYYYSVQLEPHERFWLFALDYPTLVPPGAGITSDFMLHASKPVTNLQRYQMISEPDFIDMPVLHSDYRRIALRLPAGRNPRTRDWVAAMRQSNPADEAFIAAALRNFNRSPFAYSLDPPPLLGRHVIDEFMFGTRNGYCEHYASAFAVILRMAGIPSRVVTGYQGGYYNPAGDYLLVRQSDAHAWTEAWLPKQGWTRYDPTSMVAPERVQRGALDAIDGRRMWYDFAWLRGLKNSADLVQHWWNQWVIAYDSSRQRGLLNRFGLSRLSDGMLVAAMLTLGLIISLLLLPLIKRLGQPRSKDAAQRLYQKYLRWLRRKGVKPAPQEGALELARRAAQQLPQLDEAIQTVAERYYQCRYGRAGSEGIKALRQALAALP